MEELLASENLTYFPSVLKLFTANFQYYGCSIKYKSQTITQTWTPGYSRGGIKCSSGVNIPWRLVTAAVSFVYLLGKRSPNYIWIKAYHIQREWRKENYCHLKIFLSWTTSRNWMKASRHYVEKFIIGYKFYMRMDNIESHLKKNKTIWLVILIYKNFWVV
jgi:hypothetical protein